MSALGTVHRSSTAAAYSATVFENFVTLCVLTASLAYCAADARPDLAVMVVTAAGLGWGLRRSARARKAAMPNLPPIVVNLLVLAAIIRAGWHVIRSQSTGNAVVSDLSEFLIIIQLVKVFDRRTARDDVQLLALTLFVAIGAILTANSLLVGALIFVYTPLITGAAMALQIDVGLRRLTASAISRGAADGPGRQRHFRSTVIAAVAGSLVFAGLAFVLLPRGLGRNTLGAFGRVAPGAAVGFTDQIRLGQAGFLNPTDQTPVMDVAVFDATEGEENIGRLMRTLHLRGSVSDTYDPVSRTWSQSDETDRDSRIRLINVSPYGREHPGTAERKQVVTLRNSARSQTYLFTMWRPTRLEWDGRGVLSVDERTLVFRRNATSGQFRYTIWSQPEGGTPERVVAPVSLVFAGGGSPALARIAPLAEQILTERGLPLEHEERSLTENRSAAAALQAYLRQNATYTLEMSAPPVGVDPIVHFIFERRKGHCEYFASAMVALCQSVGLPARMAMGYLATEYNEVTGQFVVRASNAHAWAEVQIEPGRWVLFDPSPPADLESIHAASGGVLGRLRRAYEAIDFAWNSLVVSFDEQRRSSLLGGSGIDLGGLRERLGRLTGPIERFVGEVTGTSDGRGIRLAWWVYAAVGGGAAALALLVLRRRILRLLRRGGARELGGSDPLAADLYRLMLGILRRAHVPKPRERPVLEHARAISPALPELGRVAAAAADAVYRSRFAGAALTREQWRGLKGDLEAAAKSARVGGRAVGGSG